ncbi:inactive selenide, water dikinase-like protein [Dysidea avara]|uniref:inactive selenide, water dikinase-like protein n=1 Tax=Dysidea avara TaxID=196820 RepID=UPI003324BCF7
MGVGMDSCVLPTRHRGYYLVQTTDFFYPLVDDPYLQGKIACANVLSDLYAMGVSECDNMLMLLGISNEMTQQQRAVVAPQMIKGFNDLCKEAGSSVNGGQSVLNPWFIIGGVASAVCSKDEFIMPDQAVAGDVIVLTKPVGTQIAVNAHQWLEQPKYWSMIEKVITKETVVQAYNASMYSMARLNRSAAKLMHKYESHGATDVTGFGILGHLRNLASNQKQDVSLCIHTLPVFGGMFAAAEAAASAPDGINFKLKEGFSAETSGGLMVCISKEKAQGFCEELQALDGVPAWIIGDVLPGNKTASIKPDVKIIEVENTSLPPYSQ